MCLELACRLNLRVRCGEREGEQTCEQACEQAEGSRQQDRADCSRAGGWSRQHAAHI